MFNKVLKKNSEKVRNADWFIQETILQELQKPGLTSEEREYLACKLRDARKNSREWEEKNEELAVKRGEVVGIIKGGCMAVCGFITGALLLTLRKLI